MILTYETIVVIKFDVDNASEEEIDEAISNLDISSDVIPIFDYEIKDYKKHYEL